MNTLLQGFVKSIYFQKFKLFKFWILLQMANSKSINLTSLEGVIIILLGLMSQ